MAVRDNHDWLYPEILSRDALVETLKQRYIKHTEVDHLDKEKLVDLYYKYVLPLPQRKYRLNRRGRDMTKKQIAAAKKRKNVHSSDIEPPEKKSHLDSTSSRFLSSFSDPSAGGERLKPPPSCVDFKRKTIKLNSGGKSANSNSKSENSESKSVTSVSPPETDSSSTEPVRKKIKAISFSNDSDSGVKKTIKLINKTLTLNKESERKNNQLKSEPNTKTATVNNSKQDKKEGVTESGDKSSGKGFKPKKIAWP